MTKIPPKTQKKKTKIIPKIYKMTKIPLERQKNVQNTPKTQKMTEKPPKHKK